MSAKPFSLTEEGPLSGQQLQKQVRSMQELKKHHGVKLDSKDIQNILRANRLKNTPHLRQNLKFQSQLNADNVKAASFRQSVDELVNASDSAKDTSRLIIVPHTSVDKKAVERDESRQRNKTSDDSDPNLRDPRTEQTGSRDHIETRFLRNKSTQQVTSKNGYLFLKANRSSSTQKEPYSQRPVVVKIERPEKYCRHKFFESLPKYSMDQPSVNLASKYIGDRAETQRQEELQNKKTKWMTRRGFNTNTAGRGNMMGHNEKYSDNYYVTVDPSSKPAREQMIRQDDKDQFLFGKFKR